ncbi:MAG: alpha/beta hydrolase [Prevotella sp.]
MRKILFASLLVLLPVCLQAATESVMIPGSVGKLAAVIQIPEKTEGDIPFVLLLHGFMGEKGGSLETCMANALEKRGIASVRFDFNGHGESEGDFQDMTVLNEIEDVKCVIRYIQNKYDVKRIALSGHSQGGVVASMAAGELGGDTISAVVLMAPAAVLRDDAIRGNTMGKSYAPLDPPEYVEMWNGKRLGRNFIKTAFSLPIYETAIKYQGPACIIHGTGDRIAPYDYGERYHYIWKRSELHIINGDDHGFSHNFELVICVAVDFLAGNLNYSS